MFPGITVSVTGLDTDAMYTVTLQVQPLDDNRYKFESGKWKVVGKGGTHEGMRMKYVHPDSPAAGERWMATDIMFKKTKFTNTKKPKANNFVSSVCILMYFDVFSISFRSYIYLQLVFCFNNDHMCT